MDSNRKSPLDQLEEAAARAMEELPEVIREASKPVEEIVRRLREARHES